MLFLFCNPCVMDGWRLRLSRISSSMFRRISASTFGLCSRSGFSTFTTFALLEWLCFLGSLLLVFLFCNKTIRIGVKRSQYHLLFWMYLYARSQDYHELETFHQRWIIDFRFNMNISMILCIFCFTGMANIKNKS